MDNEIRETTIYITMNLNSMVKYILQSLILNGSVETPYGSPGTSIKIISRRLTVKFLIQRANRTLEKYFCVRQRLE